MDREGTFFEHDGDVAQRRFIVQGADARLDRRAVLQKAVLLYEFEGDFIVDARGRIAGEQRGGYPSAQGTPGELFEVGPVELSVFEPDVGIYESGKQEAPARIEPFFPFEVIGDPRNDPLFDPDVSGPFSVDITNNGTRNDHRFSVRYNYAIVNYLYLE